MNEDERREFAEIARKIVYLADKARREGLLAIEEEENEEEMRRIE